MRDLFGGRQTETINMGNMWYSYVTNPDTAPDFKSPPTFDPLIGFPEGRQERTIKATREELDRANVPLKNRDYCVDYFLELMKCRQEHFPRILKHCAKQTHEWEHCQIEDTVLRVKEWEREKRLKERAKRIAGKEGEEMAA
ncbi:NADH dehydrogenase [ubiquinone] 1 beta subcomplex subunit 7 [Aplysia californica]|uniref:NADH dehydrogenase [ubiquinone] 1 beta subcomplex subunit 7 n=1 Tax=Aplysia californica TaxID=6500 RepID=A0ABM1A2G9_APLCA|nr:NADH dehydrogenase [ubiquinone] 1 beta subcomplex subunit 7 [Aplysia californica]